MYTGLVSITFRKLTPDHIVTLVKQAGLDGIEWGGDIHVPHGSLEKAREACQITKEAGLEVASYGSYFYAGEGEMGRPPFEMVLETAVALQAPNIRIWAGRRGSGEADEKYRSAVAEDARSAAAAAEKAGVTVSFEYHPNTLTDTAESASRLLRDIGHRNIRTYWQPPVDMPQQECIKGLRQVIPWLTNIHAYKWASGERRPLAEGVEEWREYIKIARETTQEQYCLLEFVRGDSPEQFLQDAEALKKIIQS